MRPDVQTDVPGLDRKVVGAQGTRRLLGQAGEGKRRLERGLRVGAELLGEEERRHAVAGVLAEDAAAPSDFRLELASKRTDQAEVGHARKLPGQRPRGLEVAEEDRPRARARLDERGHALVHGSIPAQHQRLDARRYVGVVEEEIAERPSVLVPDPLGDVVDASGEVAAVELEARGPRRRGSRRLDLIHHTR